MTGDKPAPAQPPAAPPPAAGDALALAAVVLALALLLPQALRVGLLGWDSYPIILTSRIGSFADFLGTFTEPLMDGRYAGGFYRPVLNLSVALNHGFSGMSPAGYQVGNVLLLAACLLAVHLLVRRMLGDAAAGGLAALTMLHHPALVEVVYVLPRRPEMLACLFMALSLAANLNQKRLAARRPTVLPAVLALLAMGSKETALVLPALSLVLVLLFSPRPTLQQRGLHALVAAAPTAAALVLILCVRFAVLGGIGGHGPSSAMPPGDMVAALVPGLLAPQGCAHLGSPQFLVAAISAAIVLTLITLGSRRRQAAGSRGAPAPHRGPAAIAVGALWIFLTAGATSFAGRLEPWYFLLPAAGLAIMVGGLCVIIRAACLHAAAGRSVTCVLAGIVLAAFLAHLALDALPIRTYPEFALATQAEDEFLADLHAGIAAAPPGIRVEAPPVPRWVQPAAKPPAARGVAILWDYSIQAWAELSFPQRKVRVVLPRPGADLDPAADEVVVLITSLREGLAGP